MSFTRPARCLLTASKSASCRPPATSRCIHNTTTLLRGGRSSSKASGPPAISRSKPEAPAENSRKRLQVANQAEYQKEIERRVARTKEGIRPYTAEEWKALEEEYTPDQIEVIKAGEAVIDPDDLARQGAVRTDPMRISYMDDFSKIDPVLDKRQNPDVVHYDPDLQFKDEDDFAEDWAKFIDGLPKDADPVELLKFFDNTRMTIGKPEAELEPTDYTAPDLPRLQNPLILSQVKEMAKSKGADENQGFIDRLRKQSGLTQQDILSVRTKRLLTRRVVNQTRMGKIPSIHVMYVAGNGDGLLGIGEGKATEIDDAARIARFNAIRNMVPIPRYERRTIFGDVSAKVGATELTLYTRPPGFGVRCSDKIYEMCQCAGIADIAARVTRARNPMNVIKAVSKALLSQRDPEEVARARGIKLVDVRKVYYAGGV